MRDLSCIASILFANVNFTHVTHVRTYARKNYATLEINLKVKGDKDDGLTTSKNGLGLSEQTASVIVQVFF